MKFRLNKDKNTKDLEDVIQDLLPILEKQLKEVEAFPPKIAEKYGLVNDGDELSDEDNVKAVEEWKDVYRRIIFLIKEMDSTTCTNPINKTTSELFAKKVVLYHRMVSYKDKNEDELRKLKEDYLDGDTKFNTAYDKLQEYQDKCKNELFDLLKTWWWELLSC